ncbi:hypothetical protein IV102_19050 [bacterium]|nr:hypothetical protein [bacterium]
MRRRWLVMAALAAISLSGAQALPSPQKIAELRARTPQFEVKVARAFLKVQKQNPGVAPGLLRHLLTDLGEEPWQALVDVHKDIRQRYPDFDHELAMLLRRPEEPPAPGLRSWVLTRLAQQPELPPRPLALIRSQHPKLLLGLALAASRLVDENYPDLPQRWLERDAHMGPAAFLLDNYPDLIPQLVASLSQEQRSEARQALLEILQQREDWARRQPAGRLGEEFEAMLSQFPGLPQRWSERSERRQQLHQKFPDLREVIQDSLRSRHPDLVPRALASLRQHSPNLREQVKEAFRESLGPI